MVRGKELWSAHAWGGDWAQASDVEKVLSSVMSSVMAWGDDWAETMDAGKANERGERQTRSELDRVLVT